jgi:PAS domain S-box-containing protein
MSIRLSGFLRLFVPLAALLLGTVAVLTVYDHSLPALGGIVLALLLLAAFGSAAFQVVMVREAQTGNQFKAYFERAMVGMATTSPDKGWVAVNPALCRILGYSEAELLTKTWSELTYPEDLAADLAHFERVLRGESEGYTMEKRFVRKDGQLIDATIAAECVRRPDRSIDYFVAIVEDISARKRATRALQEQQGQLHSLSNNLPDSYLYQFALTENGRPVFRYLSSGVTRVHGISGQAVLDSATTLFALTDPDSLAALHDATTASAKNLAPLSLTLRVRMASGDWGWLQLRCVPRRTAAGELIWDGVATDVTEQHENELTLRHISRRVEVLLELPQTAEQLDDRALMQHAMEQAESLTGSQIAFIHLVNADEETIELVTWSSRTLAHYCTAVFDRHYPISQAGIWAEAARTRQAVVFNDYASAENRRGLPEGHSALTRLMSVPVIEAGKVRMMAGVGNKAGDYTQIDIDSVQLIANFTWRLISKRKADLALGVASRVVNASSVVCFRWRAEAGWPVDFVSDNVRLWGYERDALLDGKLPFAEMVHPDDLAWVSREVVEHSAAGQTTFLQEYRIVTQAGQIRWVSDETNVIRTADGQVEFYDGVLSDITERKLAEQNLSQSLSEQRALNKKLEQVNNQLLQSEKMASIGQLAAGVAHELNNPIGFVHSNLGTLEGYLRDLLFIVEAYDKAMNEGDFEGARVRMDEIRDERDFDFVREDIFQLIKESLDGIDRVRRIVLDLKTFSRPGSQDWAYADINEGLTSTLNIVWNELKYKCKVIKEFGELPPVYCQMSQINQVFLNLLVNAGQSIEEKGEIILRSRREGEGLVVIEVGDTGKGIPPENRSRIFDPFFTTKAVGKGTGLGLSLSYSIVQAHHGRIELESEVGKGSTFRVVLPVEKPATKSALAE